MTDQNPYAPPQWDVPAPEPQAANAAGFLPNGRGVDAGRGFQWISEAFELFKKSPGIWIVMFIVHMVITWVLGLVPGGIGSIAGYVLSPIFSAGYAIAAQTVVDQKPLEIGALFAGFNKRPGRLFALGGFYTGGIVLAVGAFLGIAWKSFETVMAMSKGFKGDIDPAIFPPLIIAGLVSMVIMIPVSMAIFYAPALVVLNDVGPGEALKGSFLAAAKNVLPFIVYSMVVMVLMVLAAIPCFLGFLVLMPTLMAAVYTSYRDVFYERERF